MTGITNTQFKDIFDTTMKDFPKPPVADLLCGIFTNEELDIAIDFIEKYYTKEEIFTGMNEYIRRCKLASKLYGLKR